MAPADKGAQARSRALRTEEDWFVLRTEITEAFSPGSPIRERAVFAGRIPQIRTLIDTIHQRGMHSVVFGERGVGKTSLVNILQLLAGTPNKEVQYVRVNASPDDSFSSLFRKVFKRLRVESPSGEGSLADTVAGDLSPDDIQLALSDFSENQVPIIVLDEFDRLADKTATTLVADTIKALSDYAVNATLVIVGVAENVAGLLSAHESVSRCLVQIKMPRMSQDELAEIISQRYRRLGISISDDAIWKATFLSRGLPYYTHLLGQNAAIAGVECKRTNIDLDLIDAAMRAGIERVDQAIREKYHAAIRSQRPRDTLYEPVLIACALAQTDELGRFQQMAVSNPLNKIRTGKDYTPTTFAYHMNEFCRPERGGILQRLEQGKNLPLYRFADPLMQPFIILKGLTEGLITDQIAEVFANRRQLQLSTDW